ncbi:MAG: hypothetical protein U0R51_03065 [Solirubrobacterales bacterium]
MRSRRRDRERLQSAIAAAPEGSSRFVGHTSGATTLGALAAAGDAGAETFSLHPLQTVPDAKPT